MDSNDVHACLTLLGLPGAGAVSALKLLHLAGSPAAALALGPTELRSLGLRAETLAALQRLRGRPDPGWRRWSDWLQGEGIAVLTPLAAGYPAQLRVIACPPPVLFVRGDPAVLSRPQVAIVGSRRPSPAGRETAFGFATDLAKYALTVTSGLAVGIDSAAHLGAVEARGASVAVLGTGPDRVYPARNAGLAGKLLASGGALVTEFPPGTRPDAPNFPRRNRIISGLALGVVVVEAGLPSGSLLTARHALEQDREVMAVPGPVRSPTSRGCHELLRQGAALVESAADVVRALGDRFRPHPEPAVPGNVATSPRLSALQRRVLEMTGFEEVPAELIVQLCGLEAAVVGATLVELELLGLLESGGAGFRRLR